MKSWHFVLVILALVCFLLEGLALRHPRVNLLGLGLALWVLSTMV